MKLAIVHPNYNRRIGGGGTYSAQVSKILKKFDKSNKFDKVDLFMISKAGRLRKHVHINPDNTEFEVLSSSYKGKRKKAIDKLQDYDLIHMTTVGSSEYKDGSYQNILDETDCPIVLTFHDARDFTSYNGEGLNHWEKYLEEGRVKAAVTMRDEVFELAKEKYPELKIYQSRLPYIPKPRPDFNFNSNEGEIISTCRISAEKGLDKFAYAMDDIAYDDWYMYSQFTNGLLKDDLYENIEDFDNHYRGTYREDEMEEIFRKSMFQVDLMNIKNDGANAQYSQLEAVNYLTIPVVMDGWCRDFITFDLSVRKTEKVRKTILGALSRDKVDLAKIAEKNFQTLNKLYRPEAIVQFLYNAYKEALN